MVPGLHLGWKTGRGVVLITYPSCNEVQERVELHLYSLYFTSGPSRPVIGWTSSSLPFYVPTQCAQKEIYFILQEEFLYGCETWSLTLREERRLRVFENRALWRIFGPKRDEVTGNGENYIMRSLIICTAHPILFGWWAGRVGRVGERRGVYRVLVGNPEGKRPLGRHRHRWEDNINMDLQEVGCEDMDWIEVA